MSHIHGLIKAERNIKTAQRIIADTRLNYSLPNNGKAALLRIEASLSLGLARILIILENEKQDVAARMVKP